MEPAGDLAGTGDRVSEGFDDEEVREIRVTAMFLYETELISLDAAAVRIDAFPSTLIDLEHKRQAILHDRMIDPSPIEPFGIHTASAFRTVMDAGDLFDLDRTYSGGLPDRNDFDPGIFNVK